MSLYQQTNVTLTAGQAAGTDPLMVRPDMLTEVLIVCNNGANPLLLQAGAGGTLGFGLPVPVGSHVAIGKDWPDWDNDIYVLGTTGDKVTLFTA